MASVEINRIILAAAQAALSSLPDGNVQYPNDIKTDIDPDYLQAQVVHETGLTFNKCLADKPHQRATGALFIKLLSKPDVSLLPAYTLADSIVSKLQNTHHGLLTFFAGAVQDAGRTDFNNANNQPEMYQINVRIPYVYN